MGEFDIIAQDAITVGLEDIQLEIDKMIKPAREEVRAKAQLFLQAYKNVDERYKSLLSYYNKNSSRHLKQWAELEVAREKFDDFQNAINAYYGQLIKIMYVYIDPNTGATTLSTQDNSSSLLQINKNYGNVQYHLNQIKTIFKLKDYDSTLLDATEQSIYARWQIAKAHTKSNRYLPILWKIGNSWSGAKVNNLGTIAEAYVNFYLAKFQFSGFLENDVGTYILHPNLGAAAVDNASGFLIGDSSALDGRVQFAVKKDTASPMRMKTVYDAVSAVVNSDDFIEALGERFITMEKEKAKQNQAKELSGRIEETYNSLIDKYENEKIINIPSVLA